MISINSELKLSGLGIGIEAFLLFVKKTTEARESAKFEFTKSLSLVLDYIVSFGSEIGIN